MNLECRLCKEDYNLLVWNKLSKIPNTECKGRKGFREHNTAAARKAVG